MKKIIAAMLAAASCAGLAQAQQASTALAPTPSFTLDQAVAAAGGSAPASEAAAAAVEGARAGRTVAGLRPNPVASAQVENIGGSRSYGGLGNSQTTVSVALPIELGRKRSARVAVASAQLSRAELQAAMVAADVRLSVTQLYVEAVAANRRLATVRDQVRIATEALRAAAVRVQAGRASPLEEQRADVARVNAEANVERTVRLADAARANLARRIGRPFEGPLDTGLLEVVPQPVSGPPAPIPTAGTLMLAAADADISIAEAGVRLARANRVPDLNVGPGFRQIQQTRDVAAVFTVSIPIPVFNNGRAAMAQARADQTRAEAQHRVTELDLAQAITDAQAEAANAATTALATAGPALTAAQEAARIARIGYREGKFGQLDLLDAERTLADTRVAAIDALANYQTARARLERLTAPAPSSQGENQ